MSSDANGGMALYENGVFVRLPVTKADFLPAEFRGLVFREGIPLETALTLIASYVAEAVWRYSKKGAATAGLGADSVIARGKFLLKDGKRQVRVTFEEDMPLTAAGCATVSR